MRLWFGELATHELVTSQARNIFLKTIRALAREVLEALRDGMAWVSYRLFVEERELSRDPEGWRRVVSHYRQRYGERVLLAVTRTTRVGWATVRHASAEEGYYPDLLPLKYALLAWAERFHLADEWVLDAALDTLHRWTQWRKAAEVLEWAYIGGSWWAPVSDEEQQLIFRHAGWDPTSETWESFESRLRADVEWWLEKVRMEYRPRLLALCEERGWRPTPIKRNRSGSPLLHFEWLVRYQVQEWGYARIAQAYTDADPQGDKVIGEDAVRKAVKSTADLLGLTLRK